MIIKLPITDEEIYREVSKKYLVDFWTYIIDSKYRKSVGLVSWIKEQVTNPVKEVQEYADKIPIQPEDNYDTRMLKILRYVRSNFQYISDTAVWGMSEHWNTGIQSVSLGKGDCEDGAILMYILARLHGIPANHLMLFAGDVDGGGHCWLGYRPLYYPINFVFMDWCYWYNDTEVQYRRKFDINGTKIIEYYEKDGYATEIPSNYFKIWFAFNEENSHSNMSYQI